MHKKVYATLNFFITKGTKPAGGTHIGPITGTHYEIDP
jgi:hypothetical protein